MMADVNWIAFCVGVIAATALGMLVYSPAIIRVRWAEGTRIDPEPPAEFPVKAFVSQVIMLSLMALIIAVTETVLRLDLAILAILVVAAQAASIGIWAQKSAFAVTVDTLYALGAGIAMILAHALL